ncbi:solute carrier family 35 member f5-like [Plakobranchus ocellatus]|uniref:Solute carrier family 35 member F5 n=1 Tax=Plakobranchus ocellatus TaxID=259542 RepID=A0AAV4D3D3_9GAST|nr:solute carrier family 35 member f5-like [Plakobranchus ocellatus]
MLGLSHLGRTHRFMLGLIVLLIVDVIWVVSSELTRYIFEEADFSKPFFTTYVKTVMFSLYLVGFLIWKPWRDQCCLGRNDILNLNGETASASPPSEPDPMLGSPIYVPVKYDSHASGGESDDAGSGGSCRSVRFNNLSEVRQLSDTYALEHKLARLSYQASVEATERMSILQNRLPIRQVFKLACVFCILWFFANYTYQIGLEKTEPAVVNILSSTSGLFTLVCAAVFPSGPTDKFTLSKLVAVLISLGGIVMVCKSDMKLEGGLVPVGAIWALVSAALYSFYLVLIKRKVENEDKMDIPMFFGFVGMFCMVLLWPGFVILNASGEESFQWPTRRQWLFILINGAIGTVLSEFLWLLGCFLTSSLVGTLSLSLVIPLSMIADGAIKSISFSVWFYVGSIPIIVSFVAVSLLTHWDSWDPVLLAVKKAAQFLCRRKGLIRVRELDREQTASLITEESHH